MKLPIKSLSISLLLLGPLLTGCMRSRGEVWEDTKTGTRYVGKAFKSMGGKHGESRELRSPEYFVGPIEEDFIPLCDSDLYRQICLGDADALRSINADTAIPQPREMPGEVGSSLPSISAFKDPSGELAAVFQRLHFETDDYVIRGAENLRTCRQIADYLQRNPGLYVFIEGHCDERGPAAYNLSLGSRRANAVRNQLIKEGASVDRLFTISYGKERPLVQAHTSEAWQQNRRAQFKVHRK